MPSLSSIVITALIGVVSGFLISIPVGPINITIIHEGARRGFRWALMIGLGAVLMDAIYCSLAFAGFSSLFTTPIFRAGMELFSFVAMVYLGTTYLLVRDLPATTKSLEKVEHTLHPHTAFMIGFVRVLGNPAVLLFWITLAATFISHEWIEEDWVSKAVCVAGMSTGALLWFVFLSFVVSLGHGRFSTKTLVRLSHISGASLIGMGMLIAIRLGRVLAERWFSG